MSPEKNPFNYNILKGGQVDPTSKLYQRSISSREKLGEFLSKQWNNGADEADVFMAGVKSLMSRGHGYVGAYLDSKNPGRTYTKNEAMAITDAVMSQENIGDHPGARMTREKGDSDEAKEARAARKEANKARGFGPKQARGPKAMPVGQQRKQPGGRGKGTGVPADPGDRSTNERENLSKPPSGPTSPEWQDVLEKRMKGEATTKDVLDAFKNKYQSKLSNSPENKAKKEEKAKARRDDLRDSIATGGRSTEDSGGQPPAQPSADGGQPPDEETETSGKPLADDVTVSSKFKELVEGNIQSNLPSTDKNALEGSILEAIDILEDEYSVDPEAARAAIFRRFNNKLINGRKIVFDPSSAPERPGQKKSAPETGQKKDAGTAPTTTPEAKPGDQEATGPEPTATPEVKPPAEPEAKPPAQPGTEAPAQPEAKPPAQPGTEAPAQPEAKPPAQPGTQAPAKPAPRKDTGFKPPRQPAPRGSGGFTPSSKEERAKKVKEVVSALPELGKQSFEDFKASLYNFQPSLLGKQGSDTDPDAEPFPAGPEEFAPSSDLPGAPSSRPAPPTAKAGQPGQQSMFRADGITPRTGKYFGSKPKPSVPERAEGASTKDRLKQLMDSGLTSAQAGRQVIAESGKGPRKNAAQRKAARRKGVSNSAEYQEFAQSIRAMMR